MGNTVLIKLVAFSPVILKKKDYFQNEVFLFPMINTHRLTGFVLDSNLIQLKLRGQVHRKDNPGFTRSIALFDIKMQKSEGSYPAAWAMLLNCGFLKGNPTTYTYTTSFPY